MTHFDLQLFENEPAGGASGASGAQGGAANSTSTQPKGAYSFEQAEEIANARAQRAEQSALKSYFQQQGMTQDEVTEALAEYKKRKEKQKPNVTAVEQERDQYKKELDDLKNTSLLRDKGVRSDDLDYVAFKAGKLVDDKTDFKKAAEKFLQENPRYASSGFYRVSGGTSQSGSGSSQNGNDTINAAIRNAAKRR